MFKKHVIGFVIGLLDSCCPSAIWWRVSSHAIIAMPAVVSSEIFDSVNCKSSLRRFFHVFNEVLKRLHPSLAHRNSSSSVSVISNRVFLCASIDHESVAAPSWPIRKAVCFMSPGYIFFLLTAAALCVTVLQTLTKNDFDGSAVASACPVGSTVFDLRKTVYNKASKSQPSKIVNCCVALPTAFDLASCEMAAVDGLDFTAFALANPVRPVFAAVSSDDCQLAVFVSSRYLCSHCTAFRKVSIAAFPGIIQHLRNMSTLKAKETYLA